MIFDSPTTTAISASGLLDQLDQVGNVLGHIAVGPARRWAGRTAGNQARRVAAELNHAAAGIRRVPVPASGSGSIGMTRGMSCAGVGGGGTALWAGAGGKITLGWTSDPGSDGGNSITSSGRRQAGFRGRALPAAEPRPSAGPAGS